MGAASFSLGVLVICLAAWGWFWGVTGHAVARSRGGSTVLGLLLCMLLGPVGLLVTVLTSMEPAAARTARR
jgi:hypothetical protein